MTVAGNQIEMQHQQLGNCNLIEKGPFVGIQLGKVNVQQQALLHCTEGRTKAVLIPSVPSIIVPFGCIFKRFDPIPWRPQEFRKQFCSWIKV